MLDPQHPPITAASLAKQIGADHHSVACMLADALIAKEIGGREFQGRNYYHGKDWTWTTRPTAPPASG